MISSVLFIILLGCSGAWFFRNITRVRKNILLGKEYIPEGKPSDRLKAMLLVALGQSKMVHRPVSGVLHILVYAGFVIINLEVLEIIIDGIFSTHRVFYKAGMVYDMLIGFFEILALLVFMAVVIFWWRRNVLRLPRFTSPELRGWPQKDANIILITEMFLMTAFLLMNASDKILQDRGVPPYVQAGWFPVSSLLIPVLQSLSTDTLVILERIGWWGHIIGIFAFLNYLPYSKHLHIILAFPNTYYSRVRTSMGKLKVMPQVTDVVAPNFIPDYTPVTDVNQPGRFGARDVFDLTWKNLLEAYTCTECGRCTSSCPQNQTGKKLSPRKIIMDTRDRLEEVGRNIAKHGSFVDDGKALLGNYITPEEIWACNTCQACVQECPVNINPLEIILELRRYLLMEESRNPAEWTSLFTNLENNGAPWQFSSADRMQWVKELKG